MKEIIFGVFSDIMALFVNILTKFQNLIVKIKDLMMKLGGTMAAIVYIAEGLSFAGNSVWKGPVGKLVRLVCFHPNTPVTMADGSTKKMKNIVIGEKLANNIEVSATMIIKGNNKSPYYKIWSNKLNDYILVTADHLIQHPITKKFIEVQNYEKALPTNTYGEKLNCLVTSTNTIPIGEYIFWDWED
jgi:hypothetical protein